MQKPDDFKTLKLVVFAVFLGLLYIGILAGYDAVQTIRDAHVSVYYER